MKRFSLIGLVVVLLLMVSFWIAEAEQEGAIVQGYSSFATKGDVPGQGYECSDLTKTGYTCNLYEVIAVFKEDPKIEGSWKDSNTGDYVLMYNNNPTAFRGATFYALEPGQRWRGGKKLENIKVKKMLLAEVPITGEPLTLKYVNTNPDVDIYYQPVVFLIQFDKSVYSEHDGRAWGGQPDFYTRDWLVWNRNHESQLRHKVNNRAGKVEPPDDLARKIAKDLE